MWSNRFTTIRTPSLFVSAKGFLNLPLNVDIISNDSSASLPTSVTTVFCTFFFWEKTIKYDIVRLSIFIGVFCINYPIKRKNIIICYIHKSKSERQRNPFPIVVFRNFIQCLRKLFFLHSNTTNCAFSCAKIEIIFVSPK